MSKEHLGLLATMSGTLVSGCGSYGFGDIAGLFVKITQHLARGRVRAAALFEVTGGGNGQFFQQYRRKADT